MIGHFADLNQTHSIGGMSDHSVNGDMVSTGVKNAFSQDIARTDGTHEWVVQNAQGGHDVYHGSTLFEKTIPTGHGSHGVYDSQMQLKATIHPNMQHGHDVLHGGTLIESSMPLGHGASTVMHYSDPLIHLSEYSMTKLVLG
jgi:hypothetical protein